MSASSSSDSEYSSFSPRNSRGKRWPCSGPPIRSISRGKARTVRVCGCKSPSSSPPSTARPPRPQCQSSSFLLRGLMDADYCLRGSLISRNPMASSAKANVPCVRISRAAWTTAPRDVGIDLINNCASQGTLRRLRMLRGS